MLVLGIDPGYAIVGYGLVVAQGTVLTPKAYGTITTQAHTEFVDRLSELYNDICELLSGYKPDALAIESLFYQSNQKTVIAVAQARGVILLAAKQAAVPIYEYTPLQVKQGVAGYGRATKKQVQEMTRRLLQLKSVPRPDDAADALAIAVCHAHSAQSLRFGKNESKRRQMGYY